MDKIISLKKNSEFQRLYKKGASCVTPTMVIYCIKKKKPVKRLGITAGKKLGGAVMRNRAKRRIRELYRLEQRNIAVGADICIVARGRVITESADRVAADFRCALSKLGLLKNEI